MEVLKWVLIVGIFIVLALLVFFGGMFVCVVAQELWPVTVGLIGGLLIWVFINDNMGMAWIVMFVVVQYLWWNKKD